MSGLFSSGKKDDVKNADGCDCGNAVSEIANMKREMDEQTRQIKELSNAMISLVEKVKMLKSMDGSGKNDELDKRIMIIENKILALEKTAMKMPEKREHAQVEEKIKAPIKTEPVKDKSSVLPELPPSLTATDIKKDKNEGSHVIETTIEPQNASKESANNMIIEPKTAALEEEKPKGNIFSNLAKKLFGQDEGQLFENKQEFRMKDKGKLIQDQKAQNDKDLSAPVKKEMLPAIPPAPTTNIKPTQPMNCGCGQAAQPKPKSTTAAPVQKKAEDHMATDKDNISTMLDKQMAEANAFIDSQKYSEATDMYLKIADAYEKNKDNPSLAKYALKIDELYERISSRLLSSLMVQETAKKTQPSE